VVANAKIKPVVSESSQYSECENRIRQQYQFCSHDGISLHVQQNKTAWEALSQAACVVDMGESRTQRDLFGRFSPRFSPRSIALAALGSSNERFCMFITVCGHPF
jgi:hypothetical protein